MRLNKTIEFFATVILVLCAAILCSCSEIPAQQEHYTSEQIEFFIEMQYCTEMEYQQVIDEWCRYKNNLPISKEK